MPLIDGFGWVEPFPHPPRFPHPVRGVDHAGTEHVVVDSYQATATTLCGPKQQFYMQVFYTENHPNSYHWYKRKCKACQLLLEGLRK